MLNDARRQWIQERTAVLAGSTSPEELEGAGAELAASDDPDALEALVPFLKRSDFLDRLDPIDSQNRLVHLGSVLSPLKERPSPEVAQVCLEIVDDPLYLEHDRKSLVLAALAAVVPMRIEAAEAFRRANEQDYFAYNALLLAGNGSPVALALYRSMMSDREVEVEARVELLHNGIMPYRTNLRILHTAAAIFGDALEDSVGAAAIESVFDYKTEWFTLHGPTPPGWRTAANDVLEYLVDLGAKVKTRTNLPATVRPAIDETTQIARALLQRRETRST
jgi:hypothetical protein